jgi:hypothetical protein
VVHYQRYCVLMNFLDRADFGLDRICSLWKSKNSYLGMLFKKCVLFQGTSLVWCNIFFFSLIAVARSSSYFGRGYGRIWLDDVKCVGTEDDILNCSHRGIGVHNCSHGNDASVSCKSCVCVLIWIYIYNVYDSCNIFVCLVLKTIFFFDF